MGWTCRNNGRVKEYMQNNSAIQNYFDGNLLGKSLF
jgi:hypothetical protein